MKEGKAGILSVNSPRGTADICGEDIKYRDFIITTVRELFEIFNFEEIIPRQEGQVAHAQTRGHCSGSQVSSRKKDACTREDTPETLLYRQYVPI